MSTELPLPDLEPGTNRRRALRPLFLATVLGIAVFMGLLFWPSSSQISPFDLSREDGRSRFYATTYPKTEAPPNLTLPQRLSWAWMQYQRRHRKRNPAACSFPATPVQFCSIHGLLNQYMEVTGTRYLIAVEIVGGVEFGNSQGSERGRHRWAHRPAGATGVTSRMHNCQIGGL